VTIHVEVIPHESQRYSTCGDWTFEGDSLKIFVSDMGDEKSNMLVAVHEIVESLLCRWAGIQQKDVDVFDIEFEKNRTDESLEEPGDSPDAPYNVQHRIADTVERLMALHVGVHWFDHDAKVNALFEEKETL
jgi:hypothetical protein